MRTEFALVRGAIEKANRFRVALIGTTREGACCHSDHKSLGFFLAFRSWPSRDRFGHRNHWPFSVPALAAPGVSNLAIQFELRGASFGEIVNDITYPTGDRM